MGLKTELSKRSFHIKQNRNFEHIFINGDNGSLNSLISDRHERKEFILESSEG